MTDAGGPQSRQERVRLANETWVRKLTDLSGNNQLLQYRALKRGTLDLDPQDETALSDLLGGHSVPLRRLLAGDLDEGQVRARAIRAKAKENSEERGIETLSLAHGFAKWKPSDGGKESNAPVLLLPILLEQNGTSFKVKRSGSVQLNEVLLIALESDYRAEVDTAELEQALEDSDERGLDPRGIFDLLAGRVGAVVPGFSITPRSNLVNRLVHSARRGDRASFGRISEGGS